MPNQTMDMFSDKWMLLRMQLVNWGSYGGYHTIGFAIGGGEGALTGILGASGSGKSTIIDAHTTAMMPYNMGLNAASNANHTRQDERTYASYVRGYYADALDDDGNVQRLYLRGLDRPAYAVVAETYENDLGARVTIAKAFWLDAGEEKVGNANIIHLIVDGDPDVSAIESVANERFTKTTLAHVFPTARFFDTNKAYEEAVCDLFRIPRKDTLATDPMVLLHDIESDHMAPTVNALFKRQVLEIPDTIQHARALVEEYDQNRSQYDTFNEQVSQVRALEPMLAQHEAWQRHQQETADLTALIGVTPQESPLRLCIANRFDELLAEEVRKQITVGESLRRQHDEADAACRNTEADIAEVDRLRRENGGDAIASLQLSIGQLETAISATQANRNRLSKLILRGQDMPTSLDGYAALGQQSRELASTHPAREADAKDAEEKAIIERSRLQGKKAEAQQALDVARATGSCIPPRLISWRQDMARAAGISVDSLPFAGEVMAIKQKYEQDWGLAARIVHESFAKTLLVPNHLYRTFQKRINATRHETRGRFRMVDLEKDYEDEPTPGWLSEVFEFDESSEFCDYVRHYVAAYEQDYLRVDDPSQLSGEDPAVTREGQVNRGKLGAHGGNRHREYQSWKLQVGIGFRNEALIDDLQAEIENYDHEIQMQQRVIEQVARERRAMAAEDRLLQELTSHQWSDYDVEVLDQRKAELRSRLDDILSNDTLKRLTERREDLERLLKKTMADRSDIAVQISNIRDTLKQLEHDQAQNKAFLTAASAILPQVTIAMTATANKWLSTALEVFGADVDFDSLAACQHLDDVRKRVLRQSDAALRQAEAGQQTALDALQGTLTRYWVAYIKGTGTHLDIEPDAQGIIGAADYGKFVAIYDKMQAFVSTFDVPDFARRSIIQDTVERAIALRRTYNNAVEDIVSRFDVINSMLEGKPFGKQRGTLSIDYSRYDSAVGQSFRQWVDRITPYNERVLADDEVPAAVEDIAVSIEAIRNDLENNTLVIDPRNLFDIKAVNRWEVDGHPRTQTYRSFGSASGGEAQEASAVIMSTALLYLLGNNSEGKPSYSTIFIDEGFIKADARHTLRALDAILGFGFQVIIACPEGKNREIVGIADQINLTRRHGENESEVLPAYRLDGGEDAEHANRQ